MPEIFPDQLRKAVENIHGGVATLLNSVPVSEPVAGAKPWEGIVHVFRLTGHPKATRAFAWATPVQGQRLPRVFAVLDVPPIKSAGDAVRSTFATAAKK